MDKTPKQVDPETGESPLNRNHSGSTMATGPSFGLPKAGPTMATGPSFGQSKAGPTMTTGPSFGQSKDPINVFWPIGDLPKRVDDGEPTIYHNIVFKNGKYQATGIDPYFDAFMRQREEWMNATDGGKNIQPGDDSLFAHEVRMLSRPPKHDATVTTSASSVKADRPAGFKSEPSRFSWLGDTSNMKHTGRGDAHRCSSCGLTVTDFVPGDTFLNQHAYYTKGECPYLKANYQPDRLKIEIGQERFRRGFVAHPNMITAPDAWSPSTVQLIDDIYVPLASRQWCYMCGRLPAEHGTDCHLKTETLKRMLDEGLSELRL